jgi:hypothetical protein
VNASDWQTSSLGYELSAWTTTPLAMSTDSWKIRRMNLKLGGAGEVEQKQARFIMSKILDNSFLFMSKILVLTNISEIGLWRRT